MSCKSTDDTNIIYAKTAQESADRRKAFIRTWRLKCRAAADSLEEGGEWLHEEFKRRIKTQTVRPSPESAAMLFWAARLRVDHPAQGRRLANAGRQANRRRY